MRLTFFTKRQIFYVDFKTVKKIPAIDFGFLDICV